MLHLVLLQCVVWLSRALELKSPIFSKKTHSHRHKHSQSSVNIISTGACQFQTPPDCSVLALISRCCLLLSEILSRWHQFSRIFLFLPSATVASDSWPFSFMQTAADQNLRTPQDSCPISAEQTWVIINSMWCPLLEVRVYMWTSSSCGPKPEDLLWRACTWFGTTHLGW